MRMVNYFIAGCHQARNLEFYPPLISPLIFMASSNIILHRFLLSWDFVFVKATKRISMEIWRFVIWYLELYQIRANEYLKIPAIKFFYAQSIILHSFTVPMGFRYNHLSFYNQIMYRHNSKNIYLFYMCFNHTCMIKWI